MESYDYFIIFHKLFKLFCDRPLGPFFPYNTDSAVELIDSLSSNQTATSVVELTLNKFFTRHYSILPRAINNFHQSRAEQAGQAGQCLQISPSIDILDVDL